jgi:hypothetical protein
MTSKILGMRSELNDKQSLASLLALTPHSEEIGRFANSVRVATAPDHRAFYDSQTATASYVTVWRGRIVCLVVLAVSEKQAQAIDDKMKTIGVTAWMSLPVFQDAVEYSLDTSVNAGQPKHTYLAQWT